MPRYEVDVRCDMVSYLTIAVDAETPLSAQKLAEEYYALEDYAGIAFDIVTEEFTAVSVEEIKDE